MWRIATLQGISLDFVMRSAAEQILAIDAREIVTTMTNAGEPSLCASSVPTPT
jgi:hypothetical protein